MDGRDRVSILLAEYNTLRTEVLAARSAVVQSISIGSPIFGGLVAAFIAAPANWQKWAAGVGAGAVLIIVALMAWWNDANTRGFTERLRAIEKDINKRADDQLLVWESVYGWGSIFWPPANPDWVGYKKGEQRRDSA